MLMQISPAYRIVTERLVLRCYQPEDAPLLAAAIEASLDHLKPWMPWARQEPQSIERRAMRLRRFRGLFDLGTDFIYGIFDAEKRRVIGGTGLHPTVGTGAREIGYWLHVDHTGQGYATEAVAALVRVGFEHLSLGRIEIHCDPENSASAAVPPRLGFALRTTVRNRVTGPRGMQRDTMIWCLTSAEYASSPARAAAAEAFDAAGRRIL